MDPFPCCWAQANTRDPGLLVAQIKVRLNKLNLKAHHSWGY